MRILLVEDDRLLGAGIQAGLRQQQWVVDWLQDGQAALQALITTPYALVVVDLGLPRLDGMQLIAQARRLGLVLPMLALTARDTVVDRVAGLDAGADDYVVKPCDLSELAARIRALLRRAHGRASPYLEHGVLRLDLGARQAYLAGQVLTLSAKEFTILWDLLEHRGRARSREQLEENLYGWNSEIESNAVEVHIHHLRRKLGAGWIRTLRGIGYVIDKKPVA
jgi:DNA-binding response OmpR family regulator